jgi:hypothetical protein
LRFSSLGFVGSFSFALLSSIPSWFFRSFCSFERFALAVRRGLERVVVVVVVVVVVARTSSGIVVLSDDIGL